MKNMKSTKKALLSSVLSLVLCFAMLLGATFAWFTDSAISSGNKVQAGTLNVELYQWTAADTSVNISESSKPVLDDTILWEPGYTEVVYLSIKNEGNLALKYKVAIDVKLGSGSDENHDLTDVMEYAITPDARYTDTVAEKPVWDYNNGNKVDLGINYDPDANDVALLPAEEHFFALSVHMLEEAENKYMGESITFDIKVLAGQLMSESDSFGTEYDKHAGYPGSGTTAAITGNQTAAEIRIVGDDGYKVGSIVIPKDAADPAATEYSAKISETTYNGNFSANVAGLDMIQYDISVEGLKADNREPVKVQIMIGKGYNASTVKLYHYSTEIEDATYNSNTGYVTFETTSFSPFTVFYDADSSAPVVTYDPNFDWTDKIEVTDVFENYANEEIKWGEYGQWSPTEGLSSELETIFEFKALETLDKAKLNKYANWYCDFYVSLDRDLGENEIFLGGNYGSFGWIGFHNGDVTLAANEKLPLLGSVTQNPWTYLDVIQNVGTFTCGVGDVDDALAGATFTVELRLTNPENEGEFYNVVTVKYTFGQGAVVVSQ